MKKLINLRYSLIIALLFLSFTSCDRYNDTPNNTVSIDKYERELVNRWVDQLVRLGQLSPGMSPPVVARGFGYSALALYETCLPVIESNISMKGQILEWQGLSTKPQTNVNYHWGVVINTLMSTMCLEFAGINNRQQWKDEFLALESDYNDKYKLECTTDEFNASVAYAKACSQEIIDFAKTDPIYGTIKTEPKEPMNSNFPIDYEPPVGKGLWVPTAPTFQIALQPYWGVTRPFLTKNINISPAAPNPYSEDTNSVYYKEMLEVYNTNLNITPEQRIIALYWDDAPFRTQTPGGHSVKIYNQLMRENKFPVSQSIESFLKVSMAIHDAFVNCWKYKFIFNTERPITFIHNVMLKPDFTPVISTPPFPDYCSGHSNQSGAAMTIFNFQFGESYTFTDSANVKRPDISPEARTPRTFKKFRDMYNEVAMSRLYGGIHYRKSIQEGVRIGNLIGENIWNLKYKK